MAGARQPNHIHCHAEDHEKHQGSQQERYNDADQVAQDDGWMHQRITQGLQGAEGSANIQQARQLHVASALFIFTAQCTLKDVGAHRLATRGPLAKHIDKWPRGITSAVSAALHAQHNPTQKANQKGMNNAHDQCACKASGCIALPLSEPRKQQVRSNLGITWLPLRQQCTVCCTCNVLHVAHFGSSQNKAQRMYANGQGHPLVTGSCKFQRSRCIGEVRTCSCWCIWLQQPWKKRQRLP